MQLTISQQLKLDPTTVANFFMNARRRGHDRLLNNNQETNNSGVESASETSSTRSASGSIYNGMQFGITNNESSGSIDLADIKPTQQNNSFSKDAKSKMDDCIAAVCCGAGTLNDLPQSSQLLPPIFEQL